MNQPQDPYRKLDEAWRHLGRVARARLRDALPFAVCMTVFVAFVSAAAMVALVLLAAYDPPPMDVSRAGCPPAATCG